MTTKATPCPVILFGKTGVNDCPLWLPFKAQT